MDCENSLTNRSTTELTGVTGTHTGETDEGQGGAYRNRK